MSTFRVETGVSDLFNREYVYVEALVDTGATYSIFPEDFLRDLQVVPARWEIGVRLADGTESRRQIGPAYLKVLDREAPCIVMFGNPGVFLIGATALENLGLAVDPVNQRLMPAIVEGRPF